MCHECRHQEERVDALAHLADLRRRQAENAAVMLEEARADLQAHVCGEARS